MTTPAAEPLRQQVVDRIVTVLGAITAGADFWAKPLVLRRAIDPKEAASFPVYGVFTGDGQDPEESEGEVREVFEVVVKGIVQSTADTVRAQERAIADIRKAIDRDSRLGTAGTLGALTVSVRLGKSATDEGDNIREGLGYFAQWIKVRIFGDPFAT